MQGSRRAERDQLVTLESGPAPQFSLTMAGRPAGRTSSSADLGEVNTVSRSQINFVPSVISSLAGDCNSHCMPFTPHVSFGRAGLFLQISFILSFCRGTNYIGLEKFWD